MYILASGTSAKTYLLYSGHRAKDVTGDLALDFHFIVVDARGAITRHATKTKLPFDVRFVTYLKAFHALFVNLNVVSRCFHRGVIPEAAQTQGSDHDDGRQAKRYDTRD